MDGTEAIPPPERPAPAATHLVDPTGCQGADGCLADSAEFTAKLVAAQPMGVLAYHAGTGRCVLANPTAAGIAGATVDRLLGQDFRELRSWQDSGMLATAQATLASGEDQYLEARMTSTFGRECWLSCHFSPFASRGEGHLLVMVKDLTEHKRAEMALRESELRFRSMLMHAPVALTISTVDGRVQYLNHAFVRLFGWDETDLPHLDAWWPRAFPDPVARKKARASWMHDAQVAMSTGKPVPPRDYQMVRKDGKVLAVELQAAKIGSGWLVILNDLTERRQGEEALRRSERLLREAQDVGKMGCYVFDLAADRFHSTAALDRIFGLGADFSRTSAGWLSLVAPEDREEMAAHLAGVLSQQHPFDREYRIIRVDSGELRWVSGLGELEFDEHGRAVRMLGTIQDITDRKRSEQERHELQASLHRSLKMESLGSLAGGVAHDINNVLGAILGLATAFQAQHPEDSPTGNALITITRACERGRGTVRRLLGFARKNLAEERSLDLNALVHEGSRLLERTTLQRVRLVLDLAPDLPAVMGDPGALSHVLMNLCVNAVDAMPEGGTIRMTTRGEPEGWVTLDVEDTGTGMTEDVLERALDPFFTTKPQGQGTGLGLALVYGTVKAHQGRLRMRSHPGRGTCVTVELPAAASPEQSGCTGPASLPGPSTARSLRVLVVDDDDLVQGAVSAQLEALDHVPTVVSSGEEALALLGEAPRPDVVILDMNMPGLGGTATLPLMARAIPGVPIILATGRADQRAVDLAAAFPDVTLLAKPFSLAELKQHVQACHASCRSLPCPVATDKGPSQGSTRLP